MKKIYKGIALLLSALMLGAAASCGKKVQIPEKPILNYTEPAEGEEIIVMTVKGPEGSGIEGDVKIKLFADLMPDACENFTTLAKNGYYDELIFHRVIANFMIQGGDPKGTGMGGESCWGGKFNGGVTDQLIHVPGALAYANSAGPATDGSQFYIVTGSAVTEESLASMEDPDKPFPQEAKELYYQYGGTPWLDGGYTVFGQVIDGLDLVYAISEVATNSSNKPKESIYMERVTVEQYGGEPVRFYPSDYTE